MNRKERRAARKQGEASPAPAMQLAGRGIQELVAAVRENFRKGRPELAEEICQHILAREPKQIDALNFLGLIAQASGEHTRAVKHFARALEAEGASAVADLDLDGAADLAAMPELDTDADFEASDNDAGTPEI